MDIYNELDYFVEDNMGDVSQIDIAKHFYELGKQANWISVEDELPPYGVQVLVCSVDDPYHEMWWSERYTELTAEVGEYTVLTDNNGFAVLRDDGNEPIQVTHWMRIDFPKKGGKP